MRNSQICLVAPDQYYLHLPDVRIHYRVFGEGPPLVMLHGLGSSGIDWFPVTPMLADRFQLVLVDLRGHGHSSLPTSRNYAVSRMADDVWAVMEHLGLVQPSILGLSLGGCVALQVAISHHQHLHHVVLVNTFAKLRSQGMRDLWSKVQRMFAAMQGMDRLAEYVAVSLFTDPLKRAFAAERLRHNDLGVILRTMMGLSRWNALSQLSLLPNPVMVLTGDRDKTVPRRCAEELVAGLPNAQWQVVPDAGHALPWDQPDAFCKHVLNFLGASDFETKKDLPEREAQENGG